MELEQGYDDVVWVEGASLVMLSMRAHAGGSIERPCTCWFCKDGVDLLRAARALRTQFDAARHFQPCVPTCVVPRYLRQYWWWEDPDPEGVSSSLRVELTRQWFAHHPH